MKPPNRQQLLVIVLLAAAMGLGFALRVAGIGTRDYYNVDFIAYHTEAVFLDELAAWRKQHAESETVFPGISEAGYAIHPPAHAKPLHIELHRLAFRLFGVTKEAMSWLGAIMGTINIALAWWLAYRIFRTRWLPLLAALFVAVSGYNIMYAGRGYNHSDVAFFSLLTALSLTFVGRDRLSISVPAAAAAGIFAGMALACHYNVLVSLPLVLVFAVLLSSSWKRAPLHALAYLVGLVLPAVVLDCYYAALKPLYPGFTTYVEQIKFMSGTAGGTAMDFKHLPQYGLLNAWLDGWLMSILAAAGCLFFLFRNRRKLVRLRIREAGPFTYVVALGMWSLLFWGSYNYKVPRTQSFAVYAFPFVAAYALHGLLSAFWKTKLKTWEKCVLAGILAGAVSLEAACCASRLFDLGRGHHEMAEWLLENNRTPFSNHPWPINEQRKGFYPRPQGRYKLWYLDAPEILAAGKADCIVVDYPSLFHNYIYNRATHPGSPDFAALFFAILDSSFTPLHETRYAEPKMCQLENGRMWHLQFSAGRKLSHCIRAYDTNAVFTAYAHAAQQMQQRRMRQPPPGPRR